MVQRAYSCTLKKGYARNVCAFTNYDTLTCLTRVLTFSYYHWCHASTELCLFRRDPRTLGARNDSRNEIAMSCASCGNLAAFALGLQSSYS